MDIFGFLLKKSQVHTPFACGAPQASKCWWPVNITIHMASAPTTSMQFLDAPGVTIQANSKKPCPLFNTWLFSLLLGLEELGSG